MVTPPLDTPGEGSTSSSTGGDPVPIARPFTDLPFDPATHRHEHFCIDPTHPDGTELCHSAPMTVAGVVASWVTETAAGPQAFFDSRTDGLLLTAPGLLEVVSQLTHLHRLLVR